MGISFTEVSQIAHLQDSADILGNVQELRERWESDGVLFLRGVIDTEALEEVRQSYMRRLRDQGLVESLGGISRWTGRQPEGDRPIPYEDLGDEVWKKFVKHPSVDQTIRAVLGEGPSWVPIVSYRASLPSRSSNDDLFGGRHQDGYYNRGIDFRICWTPLMDIPPEVGGLAVAPGYHRDGFLHDDSVPDFSIPPGLIPDEAWRRANYKPGDVLIFHHLTPHAPLVNTSDLVRLSIDVRVLPESGVLPIVGVISERDGAQLKVIDDQGTEVSLAVDDEAYFRGIDPRVGESLGPGDRVLVSTDDGGTRAIVIRAAT